MKIYGDLNFESVGSLVQSGIGIESPDSLPTSGVVAGRLSFVNQKLYICVSVSLSGVPTWVELTDEVNAFVYTQQTASTTWSIAHNMNSTTPAVQIYDQTGLQLIPDAITIIDANTVTVSFNDAQAGKAIIIAGPGSGGGGGGGGGGGSSALSAITAAAGANTINNQGYAQTWNWNLTSPSSVGFNFGENVASTGGSGEQFVLAISTLAGSTANPFGVLASGSNAFAIGPTGALLLGNTLQSGTSGQVLTSNGSAMAPSWRTPGSSGFPTEKLTATTNGQTVFNTTIVNTLADSGNDSFLEVFVNGVYQEQGASYAVTGANQVTFNYGLSINSNVVFISFA